MIVVMKKRATEAMIQSVASRIEQMGLKAHVIVGTERTVIAAIGENECFGHMPAFARIGQQSQPFGQKPARSLAVFLFPQGAQCLDGGIGKTGDVTAVHFA